jgi:hypothetical protein
MEIVRILIEYGCDVNEGSPPPIYYAVKLEHVSMFRLLRDKGAIIKTPESGGLAVKVSKTLGLESMLELLAAEEVDINVARSPGEISR